MPDVLATVVPNVGCPVGCNKAAEQEAKSENNPCAGCGLDESLDERAEQISNGPQDCKSEGRTDRSVGDAVWGHLFSPVRELRSQTRQLGAVCRGLGRMFSGRCGFPRRQ